MLLSKRVPVKEHPCLFLSGMLQRGVNSSLWLSAVTNDSATDHFGLLLLDSGEGDAQNREIWVPFSSGCGCVCISILLQISSTF